MKPEIIADTISAAINDYKLEGEGEDAPPKQAFEWKPFRPKLNSGAQEAAYDCASKFALLDGPRGSGKTWLGLHRLVWHATENNNALCIIVVGVRRQAEEGGAWDKLQRYVLPEWEAGQGLNHFDTPFYTDSKSNLAKDVFLWVRNKHGGWSRILLLSMPVASYVKDRVKGMEPSFVLVDEAQTLESDIYFTAMIQQLGRRSGIETVQQIFFCANPDGPSHWLYKRFFELPLNEKTGEWDDNYARFFFPMEENEDNMQEGYKQNVVEATRRDSIEAARMLRGEWVDKPTGEALFRDSFHEQIHMRGNAAAGQGLLPVKGHPIVVSYDLGAAHTSVHFLQIIPTLKKIYKLYFDELDYVGQYIPYSKLVPIIIKRMVYWDTRMASDFSFVHISDDSAFNQYRAATGSFDAWDVEKVSQEYVDKNQLKDKYVIKLRAAPKGPHSIEARVRLVLDGLAQEEILISATCTSTKGMLLNLEEEEFEPLKPKRSPYIHKFDSFTYGPFYYSTGRGRFGINTGEVDTSRVLVCGQG